MNDSDALYFAQTFALSSTLIQMKREMITTPKQSGVKQHINKCNKYELMCERQNTVKFNA